MSDSRRVRPRFSLWLPGVLVITVGLGVAYQAAATATDMRRYPAPGQLVDISAEGRSLRLHLQCLGSGSPTVVLEGGQGGLSSDWVWVQPQVAQTTRVCAYDRAGVGWSDPGHPPRDARQITQELHALLGQARVPSPYVLVGHSYGGLYVRTYVGSYPAEVAGVVLVDASHPDQWDRSAAAQEQFTFTERMYGVARPLTRVGLLRLVTYNRVHPDLPAEAGAQHKAVADTTKYVDTAAEEFSASTATNHQVRSAGNLGGKPLFVLSATEHGSAPDLERVEAGLQRELATLSSDSVHQIVEGADHSSLLIKEHDARVTASSILAVVAAVRGGRALAR